MDNAARSLAVIGVLFLLTLVNWALTAHHTPTNDEVTVIAMGLSQSLYLGAVIWLLYMALESYVRRRWPQTIISWNRVLDGRFRDTLVGNRILTGTAAGVAIALLLGVIGWVQLLAGAPPRASIGLETLLGVPRILSFLSGGLATAILNSLAYLFLYFLLRLLLRKGMAGRPGVRHPVFDARRSTGFVLHVVDGTIAAASVRSFSGRNDALWPGRLGYNVGKRAAPVFPDYHRFLGLVRR